MSFRAIRDSRRVGSILKEGIRVRRIEGAVRRGGGASRVATRVEVMCAVIIKFN